MRVSAYQLKQNFLAMCRRMITTNVNMETNVDRYRMTVQKNYIGVGNLESVRKQAIYNDTDFASMHPGDVYFDDTEICSYLNSAWEQLHYQKCKEIQDIITTKEVTATQLDSLLYQHDQLYQATNAVDQAKFEAKLLEREFIDLTANTSRIFILPEQMQMYGPATIVHCTIHEYDMKMGGLYLPKNSRVCKAISPHEIAGLINLATNSRYTSGSLFRHRKFSYQGLVKDVIEVFHIAENEEEGQFWQAGGTKLCIGFIMHPKPITEVEIQTRYPQDKKIKVGRYVKKYWMNLFPYEEEEELRVLTNDFRVIECGYPHEIAMVAAQGAMMLSNNTAPHQQAHA